jgi:hypothetical protein
MCYYIALLVLLTSMFNSDASFDPLTRLSSSYYYHSPPCLSIYSSYFIPEDGDSELQPNVFLAPKPRQSGMPPTLGQVKNAFPLPGRYHFRFKSPLVPGGDHRDSKHSNLAVWMDCVDDRQPIPVFKNSIVAKVTRTSVEEDDDDDEESEEEFRRAAAAPPAPTPQRQQAPQQQQRAPAPHPAPAPAAEPMLDIFDSGPQPASVHSAPTSNNLFDAPHAGAPASLLDMGAPSGYPQQHAANDFFGMTAGPASTPSPQQQQQQQGYGTPYPPQQQQQQQQQAPLSGNNNAFNGYAQQQGPFGGLGTPWKP